MNFKKCSAVVLAAVIAAVSTTLPALADDEREYLNVLDFGAKGDGITDDQAAFEEALAEAKRLKKPLYVPAGHYLHSNVIEIDSVTMFGDGYDLSVLRGTSYRVEGNKLTGKNPQVYNMYMIGTNGARHAYESSVLLLVQDAENAIVANNRTYLGSGAAMLTLRAKNTKYFNNYASYSRADGCLSFLNIDGLEVANNLMWNTGDDGIAFTTFLNYGRSSMAKNIDCHDNAVFSNPGSRGITVNGAENVRIYRNYLESGVCSVCVGADLSWNSSQNRDIYVYDNIMKNCNPPSGGANSNNGGAVTIRNDKGYDGATDTSRNIQVYDNDIYAPLGSAFVTYGDYPAYGAFTDNKVYISDNASMYKHQSEKNNMHFKQEKNMKYKVSEYPGDRFGIDAGPDYSKDWGLPETGANLAKGAKAEADGKDASALVDGDVKTAYKSENNQINAAINLGEEKSFNTLIIEDYSRTVANCEVEALCSGEWVSLGNYTMGEKINTIELDKNVSASQIRIKAQGENEAQLDDIKLFSSRKLRDITEKSGIELTANKTTVAVDSDFDITVDGAEEYEGAEISVFFNRLYEFELEGKGRGLLAETETKSVEPVKNGHGRTTVHVPEDLDVGSYTMMLSLSKGDSLISQKEININVASKFQLLTVPKLNENSEWSMRFLVKNLASSKIKNSKMTITNGGRYFKSGTSFDLSGIAPDEEREFDLVPEYVNSQKDENDRPEYDTVTVEITEGREVLSTIEKRMSFISVEYCTGTAPSIDGKIESGEWDAAKEFTIDKKTQTYAFNNWTPESLSAKGRLMWDKENLYCLLDVTDDKHCQSFTGSGLWNGDSVQLGFDAAHYSDGEYTPPNMFGYTEFGMALAADGTTTSATYNTPNNKTESAQETGKQCVKRENGHTIYEISMPWKELLPDKKQAKSGNTYGFALVINDADTELRDGFIALFDGIGLYKRPYEYGEILLTGGEDSENSVIGNFGVIFEGKELALEAKEENGVRYLPLRSFSEKTGASVEYNPANGFVTVLAEDRTIVLEKDGFRADGAFYEYINNPIISDDRMLVSAGTLCQMMNLHYYYDNGTLYLNR